MNSFHEFWIWTIIWVGVPGVPLWYILHKLVLWREDDSSKFDYEKYTIGQCLLSIIASVLPFVNICSTGIALMFFAQACFSNDAKWTIRIPLIVKFVKFLKKEI